MKSNTTKLFKFFYFTDAKSILTDIKSKTNQELLDIYFNEGFENVTGYKLLRFRFVEREIHKLNLI